MKPLSLYQLSSSLCTVTISVASQWFSSNRSVLLLTQQFSQFCLTTGRKINKEEILQEMSKDYLALCVTECLSHHWAFCRK